MQASGFGSLRTHTQVVVIHATDNTASARSEATYATHRLDKTSAHFYNDGVEVFQSLDTDRIAYGCLFHGNQISVQFELCGVSNNLSDATLRKIAPIVGRVCEDYGLPIRKISSTDVRNGVKGICGHGDITLAFPEDHGDHTDPGNAFPWNTFIGYVQESLSPTPQLTNFSEDDMFGMVPDGVAFNADNSWADTTKSVALGIPKVGDADWGPRWIWLTGNQNSVVRIVTNGGGWNGQDVTIAHADGGHVIGLPAGTTECYIGYKSGAGAAYLVKGNR